MVRTLECAAPNWAVRRLVRIGAVMTATVGLVASLASCGGSDQQGDALESGAPVSVDQAAWDEIVQKGNDEGEVTLYVSLTGTDPVVADFEEAYPDIDVKIENTPTADLVARLDSETEAGVGGADVAMHAQPLWFTTQQEAGNVAALQLSPDAQDAGWVDLLGENSWSEVYGFPYTIGYRTDSEKPTSIPEILESDPHAKIGLVDPKVAPAIANIYEQLRVEYGDEILDELAASEHVIQASSIPLASELAAGTYDYGVGNIATISGPLATDGAPIDEAVPTESLAGSYYGLAVPTMAPHPNASMVFVNWLMSQEGQESFVEHASPAALRVDVEGAIPFDEVSMFEPDDWTKEKTDAWLAEYWTPRFS